MKINIEYRIASRTTNWNKQWLANWARQGKPRLREDGTPVQPGDVANRYEEFQARAVREDGSISHRISGPTYLRQHKLAEIEGWVRGSFPCCEVEFVAVSTFNKKEAA